MDKGGEAGWWEAWRFQAAEAQKGPLFFLIKKKFSYYYFIGLPRWFSGKESACNAGDSGSIPRLGRSPGGGNGNPLQYSCLENTMDRLAGWTTCGRERVGHNRATKPPQHYFIIN